MRSFGRYSSLPQIRLEESVPKSGRGNDYLPCIKARCRAFRVRRPPQSGWNATGPRAGVWPSGPVCGFSVCGYGRGELFPEATPGAGRVGPSPPSTRRCFLIATATLPFLLRTVIPCACNLTPGFPSSRVPMSITKSILPPILKSGSVSNRTPRRLIFTVRPAPEVFPLGPRRRYSTSLRML